MLSITYLDWIDCVEGIYGRNDTVRSSFQLFPFYKIKHNYKDLLTYSFYKNYIKSGLFLLDHESMFVEPCYTMYKPDTSPRIATTISPILFLTFNAFSKMISKKYTRERNEKIDVYYSGNVLENSFFYRNEYDKFYKQIISYQDESTYQYFIKLDVQNFFPSINVELLFNDLQKIDLSPQELLFWKDFVNFIGKGRFPTIENSVASSYLATEIYLAHIDNDVFSYFTSLKEIRSIKDFKIVRYVDDCYIFFTPFEINNMDELYHTIINTIAYKYFQKQLILNQSKTMLKDITELKEVVKQIKYFEINDDTTLQELDDNNVEIDYTQIFDNFLTQLYRETSIDVNIYLEIHKRNFDLVDLKEFNESEVFNHILYKRSEIIVHFTEKIKLLLENKPYIFKFNTKIWAYILHIIEYDNVSILKLINNIEVDQDIQKIGFLIHFLSQKGFEGKISHDIIPILEKKQKEQYRYIALFCNKSFISNILSRLEQCTENKQLYFLYQIIDKHEVYDRVIEIMFVYSRYIFHKNKSNILELHTAFKSYFDGISDIFRYIIYHIGNEQIKMTDLFWNYKSDIFKKNVYKYINPKITEKGYTSPIDESASLRSNNPINHISKSKIRRGDTYTNNINELNILIDQMIKFLYEKKWIFNTHGLNYNIIAKHSKFTVPFLVNNDKSNQIDLLRSPYHMVDSIILLARNKMFWEYDYNNFKNYLSLNSIGVQFYRFGNEKISSQFLDTMEIPLIICTKNSVCKIVDLVQKYVQIQQNKRKIQVTFHVDLLIESNNNFYHLIDQTTISKSYSYKISFNGNISEFTTDIIKLILN